MPPDYPVSLNGQRGPAVTLVRRKPHNHPTRPGYYTISLSPVSSQLLARPLEHERGTTKRCSSLACQSLTPPLALATVKRMWLPEPFVLVLVLVAGLAAGSFANVCILRIPEERSIVRPGSYCFSCGRAILWRDNIPLLSFLLLRSRCRWCGARISARYPLVESLTCLAFLGIYLRFGVTLPTMVYCLLTLDLIVASGIDWDHMWIPRFLTTPGTGVGLALALGIWYFHWPGDWLINHPLDAFIGGCVGGGTILLIRILGSWYYKQEAMGMGDVDLMAFLGTFLGWQQTLLTIFLGAFVGALFGGTARLLGYNLVKIPFGPYLALGTYICILCGWKILDWYLLGPSFL